MEGTKKITFRVSLSEHEKLKAFASKQGLSINTLLKKAVQLNFNFKTQDVVKISALPNQNTGEDQAYIANRNYMMLAAFESLFILRGIGQKQSEELVKNANHQAKQKVLELTE